jgi:hypothetical protein
MKRLTFLFIIIATIFVSCLNIYNDYNQEYTLTDPPTNPDIQVMDSIPESRS